MRLDLKSRYRTGKWNKITDVEGVQVSHVTKQNGAVNTGVTAILPHTGNMFREKLPAGCRIFNGFGKSAGLIQINEMGTLETPILLSNTFAVGTCSSALIRYVLRDNEDIGVKTCTVNPLVMECNDGELNDIRSFPVTEKDAMDALIQAENGGADFREGAVGAGTGMYCLGFKGGIGSASRIVLAGGREYRIGALVVSNFGELGNLRAGDRFLGKEVKEAILSRAARENNPLYQKFQKGDKGSIVMILATDAPLSSRQLGRIAGRAGLGLARTGSYIGDGSGDIAVAFSTANRIEHYAKEVYSFCILPDSQLDPLFEAAVESVEESVISSLMHAETTTGVRGNTAYSLADFID